MAISCQEEVEKRHTATKNSGSQLKEALGINIQFMKERDSGSSVWEVFQAIPEGCREYFYQNLIGCKHTIGPPLTARDSGRYNLAMLSRKREDGF